MRSDVSSAAQPAHEDVEVVVDADPVDRLGDRSRGRRADRRGEVAVASSRSSGYSPRSSAVEPPPVVDRVDEASWSSGAGGSPSLRMLDGLITMPSCSPSRSARIACTARPWASSSWWATVTAASGSVRPGAWYPGGVAEVGVAPRLVERRPHRHPVAELARHQRGVVAEPAGGVAVAEPAGVLERPAGGPSGTASGTARCRGRAAARRGGGRSRARRR